MTPYVVIVLRQRYCIFTEAPMTKKSMYGIWGVRARTQLCEGKKPLVTAHSRTNRSSGVAEHFLTFYRKGILTASEWLCSLLQTIMQHIWENLTPNSCVRVNLKYENTVQCTVILCQKHAWCISRKPSKCLWNADNSKTLWNAGEGPNALSLVNAV